jgi:hypothetical protein
MALNVETGTGASNSETLCSVAYADAYHLARGCDPWFDVKMTVAKKEEALRRASDYFEQVYGQNFQGTRVNSTQALSWPRHNVYLNDYIVASDSIPVLAINATAELAYKAAQGNLAVDLTQGIKREKVGVLEVTYDEYSVQYVRYRSVDNILSPLLLNGSVGGAFRKVIRT